MQDKLHGDLEHKDMALEIDRDCHEMHNDAIDIKHHDGIEEEDVSVPEYIVSNSATLLCVSDSSLHDL